MMNPVARRLAPQSQTLRSERGAFLVETLVGAVLVAIVAIAMFSAIDGVNQASGKTKGRALAASLAQNDQERLRSMPVSMLSTLQAGQTQVKPVNGVNYNVESRAQWISDGTSATDCTTDGKGADYIKITTKVTPTTQLGVQPVTLTSIVTPAPGTFLASQGSLAVTIVDRNATGVPNLPVTITGPATATDVTDGNGCVFFGYMPVGSYLVSASRSGWVDVMGRPVLSATLNIASQQISTKSLSYDEAGSANVTFKTNATDYGTPMTTRSNVTAVARGLRMTQSGMPSPGIRNGQGPLSSGALWGNSTDQASITADNLFPFTSPYGIYAGDCPANDPAVQSPTQPVNIAQINPGTVASVSVLLPALNIHATGPALHIVIKAASSGCTGTWAFAASDLNAAGNLKFPGFPYGSYSVCADDGGTGSNARKVTVAANNFLAAGTLTVGAVTTPYNIPVPTSGAKGPPCS
jgi:Tfp pilus assembly protein PilV